MLAFLKHLEILILVFGILLHSAGFLWYWSFRKQYLLHTALRRSGGGVEHTTRRVPQCLTFKCEYSKLSRCFLVLQTKVPICSSHMETDLLLDPNWCQNVRGWSCLAAHVAVMIMNHLADYSKTLPAPSFPLLWRWALLSGLSISQNSLVSVYQEFSLFL